MFQSTNACSQKHVDPGQAAERKGTFRRLPECSWVQEGSGGHVRLTLRTPPPPHPRKRPGRARRGRGGRTGGSPPSPASCASRHSRQADARSPTRLPLAPFLSVTSYIITRANQNGSDARRRGLSPSRDQMLAPPAHGPELGAGARGSRAGGRARAPTRLVPTRRRRCCGRSPSGSCERHQLRQLLQTHFTVFLQPGSRLLPWRGRGQRWKEPLWGGESSSRPSLVRTAPGPAAPPAPPRAPPAQPRSPPASTNVRLGNL